VEHLKLIMRTGEKKSLRSQAWSGYYGCAGLFDGNKVVRMTLVPQDLFQTFDLGIHVRVFVFRVGRNLLSCRKARASGRRKWAAGYGDRFLGWRRGRRLCGWRRRFFRSCSTARGKGDVSAGEFIRQLIQQVRL